MFNYVSSISDLSHDIVKNYCINKNIAVDATLGNGHDTDFLCKTFRKVYAFDIQKSATDSYKCKAGSNVEIVNDSHDKLEQYVSDKIDCIMYNLGFLPGGDKNITTKAESTIRSFNSALKLLNAGGMVVIAIYYGHEEGKKEKEQLIKLLSELPKSEYGVMLHSYLNRDNNPPMLAVIEKK